MAMWILEEEELEKALDKAFACQHEYIEAINYGRERDNVECKRCGRLWVRHDRVMKWIRLSKKAE